MTPSFLTGMACKHHLMCHLWRQEWKRGIFLVFDTQLLEMGLVLTQSINHGLWIIYMGYLISKFKFKLIDIGMSYQYQ